MNDAQMFIDLLKLEAEKAEARAQILGSRNRFDERNELQIRVEAFSDCIRWAELLLLPKPNSEQLPSSVLFQLQKIALADDDMVKNEGAAAEYRKMIRDIVDEYGGNCH